MQIDTFTTGPLATNAYLATCLKTQECACIDPAPGSSRGFISAVEKRGLIPKAILLTHSHWDHIADVAVLKEKWAIPVYIHIEDLPNLQQPGTDQIPLLIDIEGVEADHFVNESHSISLGALTIEVIETPGHSPGGVCYYIPAEKVLFSGDTLFRGTMGSLSLPTSEEDKMVRSLQKLARLPKETAVYPGHGRGTTIEKESWLNQ